MLAAPRRTSWSSADAERYLESLELFGMRFGLDRMHRLMTVLGHPQRRFRSIHVVGTNGKSSTARMIAAILERHGIRAGAYLSPHLLSFAERVRVSDRDVSDEAFAAAVARAANAADKVNRTLEPGDRVTQFEALTAAAYDELARAEVEVAVVEAGLGGRHDATSVIESEVQVLTNVGLEHQRWLGPTLPDIAREKLAVTRESGTLVIGELAPEVLAEARVAAANKHAQLVQAPLDSAAPLAVPGAFQRRNFALATAAARALLGDLDERAVQAAARSVVVPGRLDEVAAAPATFCDGAHNPAGVAALVESLPELAAGRRLVAVVSVLDDKDAAQMLRALLPHCATAVFCACSNRRALPPATLQSLGAQLGHSSEVAPDPAGALARARSLAGLDGVVLATGSIYLVGDVLRLLRGASGTPA